MHNLLCGDKAKEQRGGSCVAGYRNEYLYSICNVILMNYCDESGQKLIEYTTITGVIYSF